MKIGIIGTRGIPNRYGGFEQFAEEISWRLAERGHDISVYNSSIHPYQEKEWRNVNIIHCSDWEPRLGSAGQFVYDLHCIQDARRRNFDVLLHLGYTSDSVWHGRWPGQTAHVVNMDGLEWKRSKYNALTRRFLKHAEKLAVVHADMLIADSTGMQQYLRETYDAAAVYIPYGASVYTNPDPSLLEPYNVFPGNYALLVARMEPENNIETIIQAYLASMITKPLLIAGNTNNKYGTYLRKKYLSPKLKFTEGIYEPAVINTLRCGAALYFHGHSVGGTNPSLLEAMACGCRIIAHDNIFNRAVLGPGSEYFSSAAELTLLIDHDPGERKIRLQKEHNLDKIRSHYNWEYICDSYEAAMHEALHVHRQYRTAGTHW